MDIVSRLKTFIDSHQIPVTQFADNCRIPRPTLSQLLNGRNKKVSDEIISKIHDAYPQLSVLWLMFGEGAMESDANIEISEAQDCGFCVPVDPQHPDNIDDVPQLDFGIDFTGEASNNYSSRFYKYPPIKPDAKAEKPEVREIPLHNHTSRPDGGGPTQSERQAPASQENSSATITFGNDNRGKRVISIVVYYDDNSYESFVPDPSGRSPFMR